MAHVPDLDFPERHRDIEQGSAQQGIDLVQTPLVRQGASNPSGRPYINYVPQANSERLTLIQGDPDTFADIIGLIGEYEGVLDRHESLAVNLGAKLTGARLLKGIDGFFDGPIKTSSPQPVSAPISWLDVVAFAKTSPAKFILTEMPDGGRCCRFAYNNVHVEITEDDWRLISSGALDRFPLEHPFEEDETAELATLDILEQRASILYKKADEKKSRQWKLEASSNRSVRAAAQFQPLVRLARRPSTAIYDRTINQGEVMVDLVRRIVSQWSRPVQAICTVTASLSASSIHTVFTLPRRNATGYSDDEFCRKPRGDFAVSHMSQH
ncbi:hypothetical protein NOR_07799 [Metarhizium rileyi]|uniref:Uncharacterized protein n=1 Tax=Metarhizium rileyi (strain RCEF 4871) TaxID=1649241 RepID=A0A166XGD1_METRR|nr:hypothetical protein NOR_07799 [Metarhizium rileyi RCEF 4871]TWU74262.1 hypothetical protein ED733_004682 [Metarhizium rileyi]